MNGRQARNRASGHRARVESALSAVRDAAPELLEERPAEGMELWRKGPAVFALPMLREAYPAELNNAIQTRRRAIFDCCCPCGAVMRVTRGGQTTMRHAGDCPASDEVLAELAAAAGVETRRRDG
ncbi:hypothetical protein ABZS86_02380 [Streptomyces sp. NPDC005355]|uniref:hypothetical protein n=1 Tax=Streptomyces sp. NPDC005355 TaxID=3157038 RepID=UPI0033B580E2